MASLFGEGTHGIPSIFLPRITAPSSIPMSTREPVYGRRKASDYVGDDKQGRDERHIVYNVQRVVYYFFLRFEYKLTQRGKTKNKLCIGQAEQQ